ncbi:MAG TPA: GAF domain-containing protein [Rhodocyclaceae bacterium]|nr:GAF domain-containing protein [Rhodocyclaceae bacterium]
MNPKSLASLHELAKFLTAETQLSRRIEDLARYAAQATAAASCSISLLTEDDSGTPCLKLFASTETLPASAWDEKPGAGHDIAGKVLESGRALLVTDLHRAALAPLPRARENLGASYIGTPIVVEQRTIGVMNLSNRAGTRAFAEADLTLAGIVAALIGKSIQAERLQTLLRSRIAQLTLVREEKEVANQLTGGTLPPSRLAKLLAKSFYKDLASAGFEPGQIIEAAGEIIAQITTDIERFGKRLARNKLRR